MQLQKPTAAQESVRQAQAGSGMGWWESWRSAQMTRPFPMEKQVAPLPAKSPLRGGKACLQNKQMSPMMCGKAVSDKIQIHFKVTLLGILSINRY